jgi:hypothetical protein
MRSPSSRWRFHKSDRKVEVEGRDPLMGARPEVSPDGSAAAAPVLVLAEFRRKLRKDTEELRTREKESV